MLEIADQSLEQGHVAQWCGHGNGVDFTSFRFVLVFSSVHEIFGFSLVPAAAIWKEGKVRELGQA